MLWNPVNMKLPSVIFYWMLSEEAMLAEQSFINIVKFNVKLSIESCSTLNLIIENILCIKAFTVKKKLITSNYNNKERYKTKIRENNNA